MSEMTTLLFFGESYTEPPRLKAPTLPAGTYRVVCGELYRILPGLPPEAARQPPTEEQPA